MKFTIQTGIALVLLVAAIGTFGACTASVAGHEQAEGTLAALDDETPDPSLVSVQTVAEGCGGNVTSMSIDNSTYTVLFDGAQGVMDDGGARPLDCKVTLNYTFPAGWTFDAPTTGVHGFASTAETSAIQLGVTSSMGGGSASASHAVGSSASDDYVLYIDESAAAQAGSVPCGATSASFRVHVTGTFGGSGNAFAVADAIDGRLVWKRCL
jgi:hypothetical protein